MLFASTGGGEREGVGGASLLHHLLCTQDHRGGGQVGHITSCLSVTSLPVVRRASRSRFVLCSRSSKVEMSKWIEDLNVAIDLAKKSQEKSSSVFLDGGLADHSNRKREGGVM